VSRWERLVAFLGRQEAGTSWALYRMAVAATVLSMFLDTILAGVVDIIWLDIPNGGYRNLGGRTWLVELLGGPTHDVVWGVLSTCLAAAVLLLLGVGGPVASRVIAFVTLQTFVAISDLNSHAGGSYDELIANGLWLLVLGGPSNTLSVEAYRTTGSWTDTSRTVPLWPRLLVVYQAILMYTTTGWQKLSAHWVPGGDFSALYYILQQPTWQLSDMSWLAPLYPLTQLGTAVSWVWEVTAPLWMAAWASSIGPARPWTRVRWAYFAVGVFFHVSVELMMNIGPFSWASLALYTCFVHPWEWPGSVRQRA
jgi:hypothetical protein